MKVCVIGPGAVGGQIAIALKQGGADTSVLARGQQLSAIRQTGLRMTLPAGEERVSLPASDKAASLGTQDIVIFTVKAPALSSAVVMAEPLIGPRTDVVTVMNGVPWWFMASCDADFLDPGGTIAAIIDRSKAISGVVYTAAHAAGPGHIVVSMPKRRLILGAIPGARPTHIEALVAVIERGGFPVNQTGNIGHDLWTKLIANLGGNLIATVVGKPLDEAFADPGHRDAAKRIIEEGKAISASAGYVIDVDADRLVEYTSRVKHRPSTLQDLEAGRSIEMDALFRAPLRLAQHATIDVPVLSDWVDRLETRIQASLDRRNSS
jgi:2-dehydropantoate 2-reductase